MALQNWVQLIEKGHRVDIGVSCPDFPSGGDTPKSYWSLEYPVLSGPGDNFDSSITDTAFSKSK